MTSIFYFLFLFGPFVAITLLSPRYIDIGEALVKLELNYWLKFLIVLVFFVIFYFLMRSLINKSNGGLKRKVFFTISFVSLLLIVGAFVTLNILHILDFSDYHLWTIAIMGYFFLVNLFALITTLVRTFTDHKYHCPHCDKFGINLMTENPEEVNFDKIGKVAFDLKSRDVYAGTTVTTNVSWQEQGGKMVEGSMRTNTTLKDNDEKEYYAEGRNITQTYVSRKGTVCCKKCGASSRFSDSQVI